MRYGYTPELAELLESFPRKAREIVQTVVTTSSDIRDTKGDFNGADATTGFFVYEEGGIRLSGAGTTAQVENTTRLAGADITALVPPVSATIDVAAVEWGETNPEDYEIHTATAYLDPDTGGGKEVTTWIAAIFRLVEITPIGGASVWDLAMIGKDAVIASGSAGDVTFTFTPGIGIPTVGPAPRAGDGGPFGNPRTIMMVWAQKGTGEQAGNVAWRCDSGNSTVTDGNNIVSRVTLTQVADPAEVSSVTRYTATDPVAGVPAMSFGGNTYSNATMTWTTNDLDLGVAPTAGTTLELILEGAEPSDTSVVGQIDDGVQGFTTFVDGDHIGVDRTAEGGSDLSAFLRQQNYDVRATLNTSSDTSKTPRLFRIGLREVTTEDVDGLVEFGGSAWAVDPITCQSEVPTLSVTLHRDGVKDYRAWSEELFSENHLNDINFRVFIGHPDLARRYWLHIDDFLVSTYVPTEDGIQVSLVSPLQYALANIPPKVTNDRTPITYDGATLKAVYDDLVTGQVGVAGRFVGPGVEDNSTTVTKTINDKVQAIDVLREITFLHGSALISSQGRYKVVPLFDDAPPEVGALFRYEDVIVLGMDAGYDRRLTEYDVAFGYDDANTGEFAGESEHAASDAAIENLGPTAVGQDAQLDDSTAKWIEDTTLADVIGTRMVANFGTGLFRLRFTSPTPRPKLEPGDACLIEQDVYVGRDPNTGEGIRGRQWARGVIIQCHDLLGTEFTAWIKSWADFIPGRTGVARDLRVPATLVVRASEFSNTADADSLSPAGTGTPEGFDAPIQLPAGSTITSYSVTGSRIGASDSVQVALRDQGLYIEVGSVPVVAYLLDTETVVLTVDATDWVTVTSSALNVTLIDRTRNLRATLNANSTTTDAKLGYVTINYLKPTAL